MNNAPKDSLQDEDSDAKIHISTQDTKLEVRKYTSLHVVVCATYYRQVHHLGHHAAYTSQLNAVLERMRWDPELKHLAKMGVDELLHNLESVPEGEREGDLAGSEGVYT